MFNLLVGLPTGGSLSQDRVFERTQPEVRARLGASGDELKALITLPTLAMPEIQGDGEQVARVGMITRIAPNGRKYMVTFEPNRNIAPAPTTEILSMIHKLDVSDKWALNRTYLAVKGIDLYRTLLERDGADGLVRPSRTYLDLPSIVPKSGLVAAMMPFGDTFNPVYEAILKAARSVDMR